MCNILKFKNQSDNTNNTSELYENLINSGYSNCMAYQEVVKLLIHNNPKLELSELNEKKCVTILRQFLKIHNHTLISKEKYVKGKKHLFYQVIPQQIDMLTKNRESEKVILSFD